MTIEGATWARVRVTFQRWATGLVLVACGEETAADPWATWCDERCSAVAEQESTLGCTVKLQKDECVRECAEDEQSACAAELKAWLTCQSDATVACDPSDDTLVVEPGQCVPLENAWRSCLGVVCHNASATCPELKCADGVYLSECVAEVCVEDPSLLCGERTCATADECPVVLCPGFDRSHMRRAAECLPDGTCARDCPE